MAGGAHSCPDCSAALAEDQGYCLGCGARLATGRQRDPRTLLAGRDQPPSARPQRPLPRPLGRDPRRLAVAGMALLTAGAVLGAALGPAPRGTLAAAAEQIVVVMAPPPAPPAAPVADGPDPPAPIEPSTPPDPPSEVASQPAPSPAPAPLPPAPPVGAPADTGEPDAPAETAPPELPNVGHVFLVVLPGTAYPASYLRDELGPRGQLLTRYSAVGEGGLANRIALISGQAPTPLTELGCPAYDCVYPPETKTVADQLATYGLEWRAYAGALAERGCTQPDPANPFLYFHSLIDLSDCSRSLVELARLDKDLGALERTPLLSFITSESGADAVASEELLREWVPKILRSPAYREDGMLVIAFDSAPTAEPAGALVLSPFVRRGISNDRAYDHYDLLRTIEVQLGFEALGEAAEVRGFGKDVFERTLDLEPERRMG